MKKYRLLTIASIILILAVSVLVYLSQGMKRQYEKEVKTALGDYSQSDLDILSEKDIAELPEPVRNYLKHTGAVGKPKVLNFRVEMGGRMRNDDKSAWMDIHSVQYNFVKNPARMFYIRGKMFGIPARGLHSYKDENGIMLIKVLGIIPVVDQRGEEMNISDTVTIFNDMFIFAPATLIDKRISWESVDRRTVKAVFTNGNNKVSATVYFNDKGQLTNFISDDRYMGYERARWYTPVTEYKRFGDYNLPSKGSAKWHLPDRDFSYAEFDIKKVEYNIPELK